jgi:hypothetical protein
LLLFHFTSYVFSYSLVKVLTGSSPASAL